MIGVSRDMIRVVETAYQLELDERAWVDQLVEVLASMRGGERGLMVYLYDARKLDQGADILTYSLAGLDEGYAQAVRWTNKHMSAKQLSQKFHNGIICSTVSELLEPSRMTPLEHPGFQQAQRFYSTPDSWGVSASSPSGVGVAISAPLDKVAQMPEQRRELWNLVGVHLATAHRLRWSRNEGIEAEEAVLEPDGSLVHADGMAKSKSARDALRDATRRIDRARSKPLRDQADHALLLWEGLVEGRWSLVERFDTDGRRLIIAHANDPRFEAPEPLAMAERQVVTYASQGRSDRLIAYALGLDKEVVAALLQSAMDKLGVGTREELIELRCALSNN